MAILMAAVSKVGSRDVHIRKFYICVSLQILIKDLHLHLQHYSILDLQSVCNV